MNFAENYERFAADPDRDSRPHKLFMAQAALVYPHASDEELEVLARQFIPANFEQIVASAKSAQGGAA